MDTEARGRDVVVDMVDVRVGAVVHKGHRPVDLAGDLDLDLVAVGRAYDVGVLSGSRRGKGGGRKRNRGRAEQGRLEAGHRENRSEEHTSELQSLMRISYAV